VDAIPQVAARGELHAGELAVAADGRRLPAGRGVGQRGQAGQPLAFAAGPSSLAGPARFGQGVQGGVAAQPAGNAHPLGQAKKTVAGVGTVGHDMNRALWVAGGEQADELVGQRQLGAVGVGRTPKARQHRQTDVPVADERQLDQDAGHHPAVAPTHLAAGWSGRIVMEGGQRQPTACPVEQAVVDGQQDRAVRIEQVGDAQIGQRKAT
jgi:hypothetical protein